MKLSKKILTAIILLILTAGTGAVYGYEIDNSADGYFYFLQGLSLEKVGDFKGAIAAYNQALVFDPTHAPAYVQLGETFNLSGDANQAEMEALAAIKVDEKYLPAYFLLGALYVQRNKLPEAMSVYEKIVSLDPENFTALYILGNMYLNAGNYASAVEELQKVVELVPDYAEAYLALSAAYGAQNKLPEAAEAYQKVIAIVPGNLVAYFGLAETYERQKETQQALLVYQQIVTIDPNNSLAHYHLGVLYFDQKIYDKSAIEFNQVAKNINDDLSVSSYFYLGAISEELKQFDQAIKYYQESLSVWDKVAVKKADRKQDTEDILPLRNGSYLHLGYIYLQQNKPKLALEIMKKAVVADSDNLVFNYFLGIVYAELKDYDLAITFLKKALTLKTRHTLILNYASVEPDLDELYFRIAVLYDQTKNFPACEENLKLAISYNSHNYQAFNYLGYSYADRSEKLPEAEQYIKKALVGEPDNGAYLDSLGWVYFRQQRYEESLACMQKALISLKDDPAVLEHIGDVYAALLDWETAEKFWRQALAGNPGNSSLKKKLTDNQQNLPSKSK